VWFELPSGSDGTRSSAPPPEGEPVPLSGSAVPHDERGSTRKVGLLVPADVGPFRRAARAWLCPYAHSIAIFVTGIAAAAPAVVALAALAG
jgi:hypothetical protein